MPDRNTEEQKYRSFLEGDMEGYEGCSSVDMVVTLHACDTATDYALYKAVKWGAQVILSVPCCQHELNAQIHNEVLEPVLRYGLLKERIAALVTDGLRAELLERQGYDTQILEFIDMEHTPKNILIRAVKRQNRKERKLALKSAYSYKAQNNNIIVIEDIKFNTPKTKEMVNLLNNLGLTNDKTLVIVK